MRNVLTKRQYKRANCNKSIVPKILSVIILAVLIVQFGIRHTALADRFDDQIRSLQSQNAQSADVQAQLEQQAESLEGAINEIKARIASLEKQIADNNARAEQLTAKIAEYEVRIAEQRKLLGTNVRQMYLDGHITTLEKLASSKDLSAFVDKQEYSVRVESKLKQTLDAIAALKAEQEAEKRNIEKLISDQKNMQSQLDAQRAENNRLLGLNQAQQAAYASTVHDNNNRIARLRREQAAENMKNFVAPVRRTASTAGSSATVKAVSGNGYPYSNAPWPNTIADPWGMYMRQCVSYTAWKVAASGRYMPFWGGVGNARNWPGNAVRAGIPVDSNPRVGDVAISTAGTYGHAMYVEAVHGDGTITISQYNAGWDGAYSEGRRSVAGLSFIHF